MTSGVALVVVVEEEEEGSLTRRVRGTATFLSGCRRRKRSRRREIVQRPPLYCTQKLVHIT